MGLDMYAYRGDLTTQEAEEIASWRKHNALHSWMEKVFRKMEYEEFVAQMPWNEDNPAPTREAFEEFKQQDFNLIKVPLNSDRLDQLEKAVKEGLPQSDGGFFFGPVNYDSKEHYGEQDLEFIKKAREAIAEGDVVFYDSWW